MFMKVQTNVKRVQTHVDECCFYQTLYVWPTLYVACVFRSGVVR